MAKIVGQGISRRDAIPKVTGRIIYGVDANLPGMLYGKILQSPYAHARILSIDTGSAEKMPGVRAVITSKDLPARRVSTRGLDDQWLLARDKVIYVGEPVAAIAADSEEQAEEALLAIQVNYEELPGVFDPEEAMKPGAPLVHESIEAYAAGHGGVPFYPIPGTNVLHHGKIRRGDVDQGFSEADHIFEDTFRTQYVHQGYMEPNAAVASVDGADRVTVWTNNRIPHLCQSLIGRWLDLPLHKTRVIPTAIGGCFGGKIYPRLDALCVALSLRTRRPVKMVATRTEEFTMFGGRHPGVFRLKTGVKKDGTITARQVEVIFDTGAVEGYVFISSMGAVTALGPYNIPHIKVDSYVVYTNRVGAASYRGVGTSQGAWAGERHTDLIASRLGLDPLEFRLKNLAVKGDPGPTGEPYGDIPLKECLLKVSKALRWQQRDQLPPNRGLGLAISYKMSAPGSASFTQIKINPDGTVIVFNGGTEVGGGFTTIVPQIVAEELEVPLDQIEMVCGDTDATVTDDGPSASRQTFHVGRSVREAALEAKRQILEIAAEHLQLTAEDLHLVQGWIVARDAPEIRISFRDVAASYFRRHKIPLTVSGRFKNTGTRHTMSRETGQSPDSIAGFRMYGAEGVEVETDPETGLVHVLKVVSAHHVGKAINPPLVIGQLEGGTIMGLGAVLMEEVLFDQGRIINPSFFEYRTPTIVETPEFECYILEGPSDPRGPYGATGIGESTTCSVPPAIGNAVFHAVGASVTDMPITPERVLSALKLHQ